MQATDQVRSALVSKPQRLDWRFLLPVACQPYEHLVLLGGQLGLADEIVRRGVARQVSASIPSHRCADAVIVLGGKLAALPRLAACLRPGAVLYYEVDRRLPGSHAATPDSVKKQLRRLNLVPTGAYWVAPSLSEPRRYIPLEVPEALPWYLSTLFVAGSARLRLFEVGLKFYACGLRRPFASIAPSFAVTATTAPINSVSPLWFEAPELPHELNGAGRCPIMLTSGADAGSRAILLPIAPGERKPAASLKIATQPELNLNTEREQIVLAEIRSHLDSSMRSTVPQPLGLFRRGALAIGVESCAPGRPLVATTGRWRAAFAEQYDDLCLAANWLGQFHRQTQVERRTWDQAASERWLEEPFAAYARTFGLTESEAGLFAMVRDCAGNLSGSELPVVRMHYDFAPWNVYRDRSHLTVIDWEFGRNWTHERVGPALCDLLYFVVYWNHLAQHVETLDGELKALRAVFCEAPDRYARAIHRALNNYLAVMQMDRRWLPLLLVYVWVEQALHQSQRKHIIGGAPAMARATNRCVGYVSVLAENRHELLARWGGALGTSKP